MSRELSVDEPKGQGCGDVALIGAGPGDPELLTVKAVRYLSDCDVVIYDRLARTAVEYWCAGAHKVYVGKRKHLHSYSQSQINALLIHYAQKGLRVARVKGGDPFIFGRGGEEIDALRAVGLDWQVIPGVTAGVGAAASLGLPLTHRDYAQGVTFVTAHRAGHTPDARSLDLDWGLVTRPGQTIVFYMGYSVLDELVAGLLQAGKCVNTPLTIVASATLPEQVAVHTTLIESLTDQRVRRLSAPVLMIMHGNKQLANMTERCGDQAEAAESVASSSRASPPMASSFTSRTA